jgi:hypothetical protein
MVARPIRAPKQVEGKAMTESLRIDGRQFTLDMLMGLGVFLLALILIVGGTSPASAVETAVLTLAETRWLPLTLMAAMFSLFMAFNLALYRHVRRVYAEEASHRRGSGTGRSA